MKRQQKSRSNTRAPRPINRNAQNNSLPDLGIQYGRKGMEKARASQDGAPSGRSKLAVPTGGSRSTTNGPQRYSYNSVPHQQETRFAGSSKASLGNADLKLPQLKNHSNSIKIKPSAVRGVGVVGVAGNATKSQGVRSENGGAQQSPRATVESSQFKQLQDAIEIAEEEIRILRENRGNQLQTHNISRNLIQQRMKEEKNKLKQMNQLVRDKQSDLTQVLSFSKILEIENRIAELKKQDVEAEKNLNMLENVKNKQVKHIEKTAAKDEKSMQQVNTYKQQFVELNLQRKDNDKDIKRLKEETQSMEKNITQMRKQNEKIAQAIRRVKDDPGVMQEAQLRIEKGDDLEKEIKSEKLLKARAALETEKDNKVELDQEAKDVDEHIKEVERLTQEMEDLLYSYAQPMIELEKETKEKAKENAKHRVESQKQEAIERAAAEKARKEEMAREKEKRDQELKQKLEQEQKEKEDVRLLKERAAQKLADGEEKRKQAALDKIRKDKELQELKEREEVKRIEREEQAKKDAEEKENQRQLDEEAAKKNKLASKPNMFGKKPTIGGNKPSFKPSIAPKSGYQNPSQQSSQSGYVPSMGQSSGATQPSAPLVANMLNQNKVNVAPKRDPEPKKAAAAEDSMDEDIPEGDDDDYEDDFEESKQSAEKVVTAVKPPEVKPAPASKPSLGGNRLGSKPNFMMSKSKPAIATEPKEPAKDYNQMILDRQNKANAGNAASGSALNQPSAKKEYPWSQNNNQASGNKYEEKKYPWNAGAAGQLNKNPSNQQIAPPEDDNPIMGPGQSANFNQRNTSNQNQPVMQSNLNKNSDDDLPIMGPGAAAPRFQRPSPERPAVQQQKAAQQANESEDDNPMMGPGAMIRPVVQQPVRQVPSYQPSQQINQMPPQQVSQKDTNHYPSTQFGANNDDAEDDNPIMGPGGYNNNNSSAVASQPPQPSQGLGGLGGLAEQSSIPSLGYDIGSAKPGINSGASDAYVPTFSVGGASRRPRRTLGQNY